MYRGRFMLVQAGNFRESTGKTSAIFAYSRVVYGCIWFAIKTRTRDAEFLSLRNSSDEIETQKVSDARSEETLTDISTFIYDLKLLFAIGVYLLVLLGAHLVCRWFSPRLRFQWREARNHQWFSRSRSCSVFQQVVGS